MTLVYSFFRVDEDAKTHSLHSCMSILFRTNEDAKTHSLHSCIFILFRGDEKERIKKKAAAQNGRSLTAFSDDGAANSLRSDAAFFRHRQTTYPVFDRPARP